MLRRPVHLCVCSERACLYAGRSGDRRGRRDLSPADASHGSSARRARGGGAVYRIFDVTRAPLQDQARVAIDDKVYVPPINVE
jgi:hypothetical protein